MGLPYKRVDTVYVKCKHHALPLVDSRFAVAQIFSEQL